MDLKKIIYTAIEKSDSVKISNTLKVSAIQQGDKITIKLLRNGGLIWTDTNTLDNIIEDLNNEISNFG